MYIYDQFSKLRVMVSSTESMKIVTATEARNNWFDILDWVNTQRKEIWIKKHGRIVVKITPGDPVNLDNIDEFIKQTHGMLKGKNAYFPYEDPKIKAFERRANNPQKLWKKVK